MPEETLSISDAAKELDVSRATLYRWIERGEVPTVPGRPRAGGKTEIRIPRSYVDARRPGGHVRTETGSNE